MDSPAFAQRVLDGLPTARGSVLVRDRCAVATVVDAVEAECRARGLEPIVERVDTESLRGLLEPGSLAAVDAFAEERSAASADVSAVAVLGGWPFDPSGLPGEAVARWRSAITRIEHDLEARRVPYVVAAVASTEVGDAIGLPLADLERYVADAVLVDPTALTRSVGSVVDPLERDPDVVLRTPGCELRVCRGERPLLIDDGIVSAADLEAGATVSNLPAGSVYWTVHEPETTGDVRLTDGVVLTFDESGRVAGGPLAGERVSHIGIGANPRVTRAIGWTIVDEHRSGAVFLALGENRYLGGENASDVNVDLLPVSPTVLAGGRRVVDHGVLQTG